jgi:His-Xaa-Ser system protein HxsD
MSGEVFTDSIDTRIYSLDIVQRVALKFADFASFHFSLREPHWLELEVSFKPNIEVDHDNFRFQLQQELLDQKLRDSIGKETKTERDLILAYAFSNTKLLGP